MTTMAYDHENKRLAIDSRTTAGGVIQTDMGDKVIENDLGLWFLCGSCCDYNELTNMSHNDKIELIPDCAAFVLKKGVVYRVGVNDAGICEWLKVEYSSALGSGRDFALSALDHGKSAKASVEYAKTRCIYTGGSVRVFDCETSGEL